jgi:hypothetical protein
MALQEYKAKRNFRRTTEPAGPMKQIGKQIGGDRRGKQWQSDRKARSGRFASSRARGGSSTQRGRDPNVGF